MLITHTIAYSVIDLTKHMAKQLTTSQLMVIERLLGKQCTLQGQPRKRLRTREQNQKLGIPLDHRRAMLDIRYAKNPLPPKLMKLMYDSEIQYLNTIEEQI